MACACRPNGPTYGGQRRSQSVGPVEKPIGRQADSQLLAANELAVGLWSALQGGLDHDFGGYRIRNEALPVGVLVKLIEILL